MRTVREAARTTMLAEGARLLPARDPPPAFDPANPTLRVMPAGQAAPAAPRTESPIVDGGGRVAYDPTRPDLREGHPGPAAVPSTAAAAPVLPPAVPMLPPTAPVLPLAAPRAPSYGSGAAPCCSGASPCCSGAPTCCSGAPSCPGVTGV